ncbi:MAG: hypothetical protein RLZZ31_500 [Actinomycetota bacterium]
MVAANIRRTSVIPVRDTAADIRASRIGVGIAVVVFWLLATWFQPWNLFAKGGYTSDFYDIQATALVHGHLDVGLEKTGIEAFDIDGKYQLYFGIAPSVMRLPLSGLFEGLHGRLSLLSQLLAAVVLGLAATRLLRRLLSSFPNAPPFASYWFGVIAVATILASPIIYLSSRSAVYHEAELWGAAAGLAGLDAVLAWWRQPTRRNLIWASFLATFALSCRPTTGAAPTVLLGLFVLILLWRRQRQVIWVVVATAIPLLLFAVVNWLRFGTLFSVPIDKQVFSQIDPNRQAMLAENDNSIFGLKFLPTNIVHYFSPTAIGFQRLFPFIDWGKPAHVIGDVTFDTVDRSSSFVLCAPIWFLFALLGAWWTVVKDKSREWLLLAIAAGLPLFSTLTIAYVAQRYLSDFVPLFIVLALPGFLLFVSWLKQQQILTQRIAIGVVAVIAFLGMWVQFGLTLQARAFEYASNRSVAQQFAGFQYGLDDLLFGGTPPRVLQVNGTQLPETVRPPETNEIIYGTMSIVEACDGLYRFDGFAWSPVEWNATAEQGTGYKKILRGSISGAEQLIAGGADEKSWTLSAKRVADTDRYQLIFTDVSGVRTESKELKFTDPVTITVIADPSWGLFQAFVNGDRQLEAFFTDKAGISYNPAFVAQSQSSSLCLDLRQRLGS